MRRILSEKNLVVVLFILVIVVFSLAQKDTRQMEEMFLKNMPSSTSSVDLFQLSSHLPAKDSQAAPELR